LPAKLQRRFQLTARNAGSTPNTANIRRAERDAEKMLRRIERTATTAPTPTAAVETDSAQKPRPQHSSRTDISAAGRTDDPQRGDGGIQDGTVF
jgi:hypothetical protein